MAESFIGEIRMFGCNYAPLGWAFCNGQTVNIMQNQALFSLMGTTFGGNGTTNFMLPDLRGRVPIHRGTGSGLSPYATGATGGAATVTLTAAHLPAHTHTAQADTAGGAATTPAAGAIWSSVPRGHPEPYGVPGAAAAMSAACVANAGGNQAHNNRSPYQVVNFCIALQGMYPFRT
jgi:microcystin-dependent protein